MSAYVAMAVLQGTRPRRVSRDRAATTPGHVIESFDDLPATEVIGDALGDRLAERWTSIHHGWLESTFFLFDPESWR